MMRLLKAAILVTLWSSVAFGKYQYCEIVSLQYASGAISGATLKCYSGKILSKWSSRPQVDYMDIKPAIAVNSSYLDSSNCDVSAIQSLISEANSKLASIRGFCLHEPESTTVVVKDVENNLTFFLMALRNDVILNNVEISADNHILSSDLTHGMRLSDYSTNISSGVFSTMPGYAGGSSAYSVSTPVDATNKCTAIKSDYEQRLADLNNQIENMKSEKSRCERGESTDEKIENIISRFRPL